MSDDVQRRFGETFVPAAAHVHELYMLQLLHVVLATLVWSLDTVISKWHCFRPWC